MTIIVWARLEVNPSFREKFITLAMALADAARKEDRTLNFRWYRTDVPHEFVVIEEYADPAAALAHNENCKEILGAISELAEITTAHVHGNLSPELESWVAAHPFASAHRPLMESRDVRSDSESK